MNKLLIFTILILFVFSVSAQKREKSFKNEAATGTALTSSDSLQYAFGAFIGKWLVANEFTLVNPIIFNKGINDILNNSHLLINDSIVNQILKEHQASVLSNKNRLQEEQLFSSLKGKSGVGALPDGVHYVIVKSATGIRPAYNDTVVINALGMFPDGTLFEDTYQKNQPISSAVSNLIPGLNEAIQLMPVGSVWRIFVPSALGYGSAGLPNLIPPDMALVFEISLLEIRQFKK